MHPKAWNLQRIRADSHMVQSVVIWALSKGHLEGARNPAAAAYSTLLTLDLFCSSRVTSGSTSKAFDMIQLPDWPTDRLIKFLNGSNISLSISITAFKWRPWPVSGPGSVWGDFRAPSVKILVVPSPTGHMFSPLWSRGYILEIPLKWSTISPQSWTSTDHNRTFCPLSTVKLLGIMLRNSDVGPPLFTLLQPEMWMDGVMSGWCDQLLKLN
jgi:hypothetical protein